uniref:BolA-like protein n=1 Tax=Clastoptera arizonana TaxID=38151 RepID=A0A1B6CST3_9HEMI
MHLQSKFNQSINMSRHVIRMSRTVHEKIEKNLKPEFLEVTDHSPDCSGGYLKVTVVSKKFDNTTLLERHRMVNSLFIEELDHQIGLNALIIDARTPKEWNEIKSKVKAGYKRNTTEFQFNYLSISSVSDETLPNQKQFMYEYK